MSFTLSDGNKIPSVGLGTAGLHGDDVEKAVVNAIRIGYRHLDLAPTYRNQAEVGNALKKSLNQGYVKREDLFITTKLPNYSHKPADVEKDIDASLKDLRLEYIDLYLVHWPIALKSKGSNEFDTEVTVSETWKAIIDVQKTGKVRSIGVSNLTSTYLRELISVTGVKPTVNQVELHPFLPQEELLAYCKEEGIHLSAYLPIGGPAREGRPSLRDDPVIQEIAKENKISSAQVLLSWNHSRGCSVLPRSSNIDHLKSNLEHVKLSGTDVQRVNDVGKDKQTRFINQGPGWDINIFGTDEEKGTKHKVKIA